MTNPMFYCHGALYYLSSLPKTCLFAVNFFCLLNKVMLSKVQVTFATSVNCFVRTQSATILDSCLLKLWSASVIWEKTRHRSPIPQHTGQRTSIRSICSTKSNQDTGKHSETTTEQEGRQVLHIQCQWPIQESEIKILPPSNTVGRWVTVGKPIGTVLSLLSHRRWRKVIFVLRMS
jgi:hypothetical protein